MYKSLGITTALQLLNQQDILRVPLNPSINALSVWVLRNAQMRIVEDSNTEVELAFLERNKNKGEQGIPRKFLQFLTRQDRDQFYEDFMQTIEDLKEHKMEKYQKNSQVSAMDFVFKMFCCCEQPLKLQVQTNY